MGAWGPAVFSDDVACDVRDEFTDLIAGGASVDEATRQLIDSWQSAVDDQDDGPIFWLALAATQWKLGRLVEEVRVRALQAIEEGADLRRWQADASPRDARKREAALKKLRDQLLSPAPPPRRVPKRDEQGTSRRKLPYREGDWFAVPLECGGYALGLVARMTNSGIVLAYFFRPRYEGLPAIDQIGKRRAEDAVAVAQVGDLGLIKGTWKVVGRLEPWTPSEWPLPVFGRYDDVTGRAWRVFYTEGLGAAPREQLASPEEVRGLPRDALWGYAAAEARLSDLLCAASG